MIGLLFNSLNATRPPEVRVRQQMSIILDPHQRLEPDVLVVAAAAEIGRSQTSYPPAAVQLVIEVVSPESQVRDRDRKPQLYVRAGIPHFWRVEENDGQPLVYVYDLDRATRSYAPSGIYHDHVKAPVPYVIDVDLTQIEGM